MKKILVIEDDRIVRENITELLEISGYAVEAAANGMEGIAAARRQIPDLIVCDIKMPDLDGYGVLHVLRKNPDTATVPFIFLTARTDRSDLRRGMEMGADDYITKPFESTDLLNAIETRLRRRATFTALESDPDGRLESFFREAHRHIDMKSMALQSESRDYGEREVVFKEGDHPHFLFFVESGSIKTSRMNDNGKEFISSLYFEGDFFGFQPLFEERPYRETAEALQESTLRRIPGAEFMQQIRSNPELAGLMIKQISQELTHRDNQMMQIAYESVRKRIALKLLEMIPDGEETSLDISRTNLAALLGTTTETIVRTLAEFRDQGLVATHGQQITLTDREKLRTLSRNW